MFVADGANSENSVTEFVNNGPRTVLTIPGLHNPEGLALDADANLFVANYGANNIVMVTPGGATSTVGDSYIAPAGVAVNGFGDVIVADT